MVPDILERFEDKFILEPNTDCWLWIAGTSPRGYGRFKVDGKLEQAHRVSYELYVGPIPDGLWVLHRCDIYSCVNPEHLFLGTQQDNVDDMIAKGGHYWPHAVLSGSDVREIRLLRGQVTQGELGQRFGVCQGHISKIQLNEKWMGAN